MLRVLLKIKNMPIVNIFKIQKDNKKWTTYRK